ncbi:hypothetical protein OIV83_002054 [Microbotryomycetes sp. JL201]|nr:hypothetical protein OIV83_002054 [Microbotryomycetes sp. JL201]
MSIEFSFAAYLEALGTKPADDAISPSASTASSSESSPAKRARSYSPDTSISSSSPAESYFAKSANAATGATTASPDLTHSGLTFTLGPHTTVSGISASSACPLRSILCSTLSMASGPLSTSTASVASDASFLSSPATTSPPLSRPLSRRSSHSTKSVRFARCTNASVFPALSGEEYDRSPIIPTQESESLELPKRHKSEEDGWIKCVERERAAAAKKGLKPDLSSCGPCGAKPSSTKSSLESPVEGVRGLISGGYFVGEERDHQSTVDGPVQTPHLGLALSRSDDVVDHGIDEDGDDVLLDATGGGDDAMVVDDETGDDVIVQDDSSGDDSDSSPSASAANETETRCREAAAAKQRYGLCALGKFTRRELFTSHDSLGGF